ncbi:ABC transporter permease [Paenibacillus sp. YN15]|uniref:ABC transporter permease n=1 Tax=Paenibacillus sp. YN15 TaxID=1742774 RepID=UPI000DCC26DC|nr:ABC transporter permease [Paenibacillus sp. YN15]RAU96369.1 ABC transporter permease [Paenibacillus sp. YN15]
MFSHLFFTRMKCLLRNKELMFWTLVFPLLMSTFFNMAFSNLNSAETFKPVAVAVVNDAGYKQDAGFQQTLTMVSSGDSRIFNLREVSTQEEAEQLLASDEIEGYFSVAESLALTVKKSGLNQSIIKIFADQYRQTASAVGQILAANPQALQNGLLENLGLSRGYVTEVAAGSAAPNNILNYFYSLIAMTCFYGSFFGLQEVTDIQADLSARAARINMSPVHKLKAFVAGLSAALVILYAEILILLAYLAFFVHVDFGPRVGYVLLTAFVGCILGLSFGALISAAVKKGEGLKTAILICVTMVGSFLSGMMMLNMKYIIAQKAPLLAYLNPVNLLTDAFYSLYYYDTLNRYLLNLGLMGVFAAIFCLGTYSIIRRRKYASL